MSSPSPLVSSAVLALALASAPAWGQGDPAAVPEGLGQAQQAYNQLEFERCLERLASPPPGLDASTLARVELYRGLCHHHLGRDEVALAHFTRALELDPTVRLPADSGPKTTALFARGASAATPSPRPGWMPGSAPPPPARVRWTRRLLVPGLGLVSGVAVLAGVYWGLSARRLQSDANQTVYAGEHQALGSAARQSASAANWSFGIAVLSGAAAVALQVAYGTADPATP